MFWKGIKLLAFLVLLGSLAFIIEGKLGVFHKDMDIEAYQNMLRRDPRYLQAYLGLAARYAEEKKFQQALKVLESAEKRCDERKLIQQEYQKIVFRYAVNEFSQGTDAFIAGEKQNALHFFQRAIKIKPDFVYAYYMRAYLYFEAQNFELAERDSREVIRLDPQFKAGLKLLGDIYFEKGDFQGAFNAYSRALDTDVADPALLNDIGLALAEMKRYTEAARYLKQAAEMDRDNLSVLYSLACVYRDNGWLKEALLTCIKVIAQQPDYPNIHNVLAQVYTGLKRNDEARAEYQLERVYAMERLDKNPEDVFTLNTLARALNGLKEYPAAMEAIRQAIALEPKYRDAFLTYAATLEKLGKPDEALEALEEARKLSQASYFMEREITRVRSLPPLPLGNSTFSNKVGSTKKGPF